MVARPARILSLADRNTRRLSGGILTDPALGGGTPSGATLPHTTIMKSELLVRNARHGDLNALVDGNLRLAQETESIRLDVGTLTTGIRAILDNPALGRYVVAVLRGRVVGHLAVTFEWSDWRNRMVWWIQSVYVFPDARRQGVLRALYQTVRDQARAAAAGGLRLYVETNNVRAQDVYAALGMSGGRYRVFEDMFTEPRRVGAEE